MDSDEVTGIIPECHEELKPFVEKRFISVEDGISFYRSYAAFCGFEVRLSSMRTYTDGTVQHRYVVCSREGKKHTKTAGKRVRRICRVGCMARIVIKFNGIEGYCISMFNEAHNHPLVQDEYKHFMKSRRMFDSSHRVFALNCFRGGILASKSYSLFKELVGGHEKVGCSKSDFKNFARDLRAAVGGADAQVVVNNLQCRRTNDPGFMFNFEVDENNRLTRLFWCDNASVEYFKVFGDVVSFDATYSTNKYNMIFAPFTSRDNHGKCVTFGAGLLNHEDVLSYSWLLQKFRDAMNNMVPTIIITDQDPALKIAVENIFPRPATRHRYCMWHIMLKLVDKIPHQLRGEDDFIKRFHGLVWSNNIDTNVFEDEWNKIMIDFGLLGHKWFTSMFDIRSYWIPAFFRDCPMGGLLRTTSMSESQNSMFQKFLKKDSNLIEFFMHYGSAVDSQRHEHRQASSFDAIASPQLLTTCAIEKHAAVVYTYSIFQKVQREIIAAHKECCIINMAKSEGEILYMVDDSIFDDVVTVKCTTEEGSFACDCNYFVRKGLLCRHMLFVFKNLKMDEIPEKYLVRRWTKFVSIDIVPAPMIGNESANVRSLRITEAYKCIGLVDGNQKLSEELLEEFKKLTLRFSDEIGSVASSNRQSFAQFYGGSVPDSVSILSPSPVKTKGSGSRLKSRMEKAVVSASKPKRKCAKCKKMVNHDSRNCPMIDET